MNIYDNFRTLATTLFAKFGTAATITTTIDGGVDFITGEPVASSSLTKDCLAILKPLTIKGDDGTVTLRSSAILNASAVEGDKLAIGDKTFTITDIQENAPDGGSSMSYLAMLK